MISNKANVKFINKTKKQVKGKITFSRCYSHCVLFVTIDLEGFELYQGRLFPADWWSNGSYLFTCWKPCDLTDNAHFYNVSSNKYEYLKPRGTISMEYDVDTESYILRVSLDKFLKETIEIEEPQHSLKNIERFKKSENPESSESANSLESFESFDTVHWFVSLFICYFSKEKTKKLLKVICLFIYILVKEKK